MNYIRKASVKDASRLVEILVFAKRVQYRPIFHDDKVSFGEINKTNRTGHTGIYREDGTADYSARFLNLINW